MKLSLSYSKNFSKFSIPPKKKIIEALGLIEEKFENWKMFFNVSNSSYFALFIREASPHVRGHCQNMARPWLGHGLAMAWSWPGKGPAMAASMARPWPGYGHVWRWTPFFGLYFFSYVTPCIFFSFFCTQTIPPPV